MKIKSFYKFILASSLLIIFNFLLLAVNPLLNGLGILFITIGNLLLITIMFVNFIKWRFDI